MKVRHEQGVRAHGHNDGIAENGDALAFSSRLTPLTGSHSMLSFDPLAELPKPSSNLRLDRLRRDCEPFRDLADRVAMSPAKHTDLAPPVGHLGQHLINGCGKLRELGMGVRGRRVERYHIVGGMLARCSLPT